LRHAFSHFDFDMKPLLVVCAGKSPALRDDDRYRWYDPGSPAEVGLPRPIATLLNREETAIDDSSPTAARRGRK
jgi:adenine-specific DNA glycosylase